MSRSRTSRAATRPRRSRRQRCVTRPSTSFRPNTTIRWSCSPDCDVGRRRQAHRLRQDARRAERAEISLRRVPQETRRHQGAVALYGRRVRLRLAAAIPGGAGDDGRAELEALGSARADTAADVWARLSAGDHRAPGARREQGRHARLDHARGHRYDLPVRGFFAQRYRLGGAALQVPNAALRHQARRISTSPPLRHARARRGYGRLRARMRDGRAGGRAQDRPDRVAAEVLFGPRPERRPALHQQAAARMLCPRRRSLWLEQAQSGRRARCATARIWSAGAWQPACGKRCRCRSRSASC